MKNIGPRRGRRAHRGALPPGVRRRRAVGAPRHRGPGVPRPRTTATSRRAAPASACARSSSSRARSSPRRRRTGRRRSPPSPPSRRTELGDAPVGEVPQCRDRRRTHASSHPFSCSRRTRPRRACRPAVPSSPSTCATTLFSPSRLDVKPGTTVRWVNDGRNPHNVTPNTGARASAARTSRPGSRTRSASRSRAVRVLLHAARRAGQGAARDRSPSVTTSGAADSRAGRFGRRARAEHRGDRPHDPRSRRREDDPGAGSTAPGPATSCWCRPACTTRPSRSRPTASCSAGSTATARSSTATSHARTA